MNGANKLVGYFLNCSVSLTEQLKYVSYSGGRKDIVISQVKIWEWNRRLNTYRVSCMCVLIVFTNSEYLPVYQCKRIELYIIAVV